MFEIKNKPSFLHCHLVSKMIKSNKGTVIKTKDFKVMMARLFHIEKDLSIIVLKELMKYNMIKSYSPKEIVFNKNIEGIELLMEED